MIIVATIEVLCSFSDSHFSLYALQAQQDEGIFPRVSVTGPSIGCFLCAGLGLPSKAGSELEAWGNLGLPDFYPISDFYNCFN